MCNISNVTIFCLHIFKFCQALWRAIYQSHCSFQEGLGPGVAVVFISSSQEYISVNVLISAPHV